MLTSGAAAAAENPVGVAFSPLSLMDESKCTCTHTHTLSFGESHGGGWGGERRCRNAAIKSFWENIRKQTTDFLLAAFFFLYDADPIR